MFKNDHVQHLQTTPTYIPLHVVYLYASLLYQSKCICNTVTNNVRCCHNNFGPKKILATQTKIPQQRCGNWSYHGKLVCRLGRGLALQKTTVWHYQQLTSGYKKGKCADKQMADGWRLEAQPMVKNESTEHAPASISSTWKLLSKLSGQ